MEKFTINTVNPDAISYTTESAEGGQGLGFTVLGGIRLDGLDRMRVTLKIEVINRQFEHYLNHPDIAALAMRHNVDLYNDGQVEKLIRRTAERLEVGITGLTKAVADLTNQLETYRLSQIELLKQENVLVKKILSEQERNAAVEFLSAPDLLKRTGELIGASGVVGEEMNRLLMYLVFTTRKREKPLHIISLGTSGSGKTYLQEKVSQLMPSEDVLEITTLSDNAFYYFGRHELAHKLILIEDYDGALGVLYPLRELKSKQKITKTVTIKDTKGNTRTIHLKVEGPVCIAGCTTQESIYEDNANRSFLIYLDESPTQDEHIMNYQRLSSAGKIDIEKETTAKQLLQHCGRILEPVTIRNPFAEFLSIPVEVLKPRRTNSHYLQFIEAITFYKQYQREKKLDKATGEIFIETTVEDIEEANHFMKDILLRKSDTLTGPCRNYFERLKVHLKEKQLETFSNREIAMALRIPISTVKRHHGQLTGLGYIKHCEKLQPGVFEDKTIKLKGYCYEVVNCQEYEALQQKINTVLDEILIKLKSDQPTGSTSAQSGNEPVKALKQKKLRGRPKKITEKDNQAKKNEEAFIKPITILSTP